MAIPDPHSDPQFYAGVPVRRLAAFAIDGVIIMVLWAVGAVAITIVTIGLATAFIPLLLFVVGFVYRWLLLARIGATVGMRAVGIEIRDSAGNPPDAALSALHTAAFMVTLGFLPLAIIGWIIMANSPTRQALHDIPFGTVAINRPD